MVDPLTPSLREYLEQRLDYERTLAVSRDAHAKERVTEQLAARDKAMELQATEYQRRLDVLNHAHQAAVEAQAKTVPREMWEQAQKDYAEFKAETNRQLTIISTRSQTWIVIIGLLFAVLNVIIRFWPTPFVVH